jgi:hypothetical protein
VRLNDATLAEHAREWERTRGVAVSRWAIGRLICRLKLTRKKSSHDHMVATGDENGGRGGILAGDSVREAVGQRLVRRARKKG